MDGKSLELFEIGRRHPLLFMHIPKTGGTTMRQFLANQYRRSDICPARDWHELAAIPRAELSSYNLLQGHFTCNVRSLAPEGAKTVVVLREPIARTLSAIRHMQRDPHFHPLHDRVKDKTLAEILESSQFRQFFSNGQTGFLAARRPANEVIDYLANSTPATRDSMDLEGPPDLDRAKQQLDRVDYVGVVEDLEALMHTLSGAMNFHPPTLVPRVNETIWEAYPSERPTDAEWALLAQCNVLDIQLYNYALQRARECNTRYPKRPIRSAVKALCDIGIYRTMHSSFELDIGDRIPGSGWYGPERDPNHGIKRWTGPLPTFTLEVPLRPDRTYTARLYLWSEQVLTPDNFGIYMGDERLQFELNNHGGAMNVAFVIPDQLLAESEGICQLRFELPGVIRPSQIGYNPDLRKLGAAVLRVQFLTT